MADSKQLEIIGSGAQNWNVWREKNPLTVVDLSDADLSEADLSGINLQAANLANTDLRETVFLEADLTGANVYEADLHRANLSSANLGYAELRGARLDHTILRGAILNGTNLRRTILQYPDFTNAILVNTVFANVDLRTVVGLDSCRHVGSSILDHRTLMRSGPLPLSFLRGCGLPDRLIDYLPSLLDEAIQFYSCFIGYSMQDQDFADRLHADLQNKGVRCWFAPHDIQGGKKIHEQIDEAIRLYDKLLLILSPASMSSEWVKTEIAKARKREMRESHRMLFPLRLADFETLRDWECFDADTGKDSAREIREYFIPDFSRWKPITTLTPKPWIDCYAT
jgi:uncharacterized protein YjbI with pentapeptide repeats